MNVKPSDLKTWQEVPDKNNVCLIGVSAHPEWYDWYFDGKTWRAHRKATISEVEKNEFQ